MVVAGSTVEVLCAEVVFNPMQLYINVGEFDEFLMSDSIHFLYTIRYDRRNIDKRNRKQVTRVRIEVQY